MKMLFSSTVGSKLHRTDNDYSDVDQRSVYRLTLRERLSPFINEKSRSESGDEHDNVLYELTHFARLIAKNNPTAMEILMSDMKTGPQVNLTPALFAAAMDTERYVTQTNGMIFGMLKKGTPKSLHHAERLATHLLIYINSGTLVFDAREYWNYDRLLAIKRGEATETSLAREHFQPRSIWHVQNLDELARIVYNEYVGDRDSERARNELRGLQG